MVYYEHIVRKIIIEKDGAIELKDFFKHIRNWLNKNKYKLQEGLHADTTTEDARSFTVKWFAERTYDDYHKLYLTIIMNFSNLKEKVIKGKKISKGHFTIDISGDLIRDIQYKWSKPVSIELIRAIFDKYIATESGDEAKEKIKVDISTLIDELKKYLNMV
ncbi:hypothetical protein J4436_02415 [Candidatus Woesearchaeota archaeon]|nr:hypothetical protein [Candidatus Woesearchaeota archaeon]